MNRPNSDYWRMRFKQLETLTFNKSKNFAENLEKIFVDASEEIDFALFKFFRQFAELEHTNVREAHRILNSEELKAFRMTLEEYIKFGQEQNEFYRPEINKVLEQASLKVRVTRLEALEMELSAIVAKMLSNEHQSVYEHLADTYIDRYYRSIFTVYKGFGVGQSFAMIDERRLKDLLETPWTTDGMDFSTRIWNNQVKMTGTLKQVLGSAIARGEGYDETSQKFAKLMNTTFTNASRVIRTESAYFASRAQTDSFKELGCEKYEIVATLDDDTDEECQQLDGKVYDVKYFEAGVTAPPFHPNCVLPETVIISPDCEALTKSYYSGDVIKITVSNGTSLSVTPNHIVLTSRGWVRAKNLIKGDKIVYYSGWDKFIVESNPTKNNRVPTIEDLFTTIVKTLSGGTISMPATAIDFKGDVIENSKIDIVFIDSFLRNKFNTSISKFLSDSPLIRTSKISEDSFFSNCSLAQFLVGIGLTSDGIMSGSRIASILLRGTLTHHELVSFRLPSDYDMRLIKTTPNNITTNREFFSKRIFANTRFVKDSNFINRHIFPSISRTSKCNSVFDQNLTDSFSSTAEELSKFAKSFPGIIEFDDVIDIDRFNYSGHVYDASSLSTLYICNGIITSNCRCATSPHLDYDFMPVGTRTARDGDGKTYRVPRNMTYPEWKKKYGNKQSNKEKLKLNKPINSKSNSNK